MGIVEWLFRDRSTGRIVVAQAPNAPLLVFMAAWVAGAVLDPAGRPATTLTVVATVALVVWSVDELVRGVNPWRRILGATVLVWQVVSLSG